MRKCPDCGFLLFDDGDACKHCGAALDRVGANAAGTSAPGRPAPPRMAAVPERLAGPPPPPPAREPDREMWSPVAVTMPPPKRTTSKGLVAIIAIVVAVSALIGYSAVTKKTPVPAGTRAFVDGHGVAFNAPDGTFSAHFPVAPTSKQSPAVVQSETVTVATAIASGADYELGVTSLVRPVTPTATQAQDALAKALAEELASLKGQGAKKVSTRRGGLPALQATFKAPDGFSAHVLVMSFGPKLYVLFTHAKFGTEALFHALDTSFVVH